MADYKVRAIWWPTGWEPKSPLDVPNCVGESLSEADQPCTGYDQAVATVRGLNQQSIDHASTIWYVIVAASNGSFVETLPADTRSAVEPQVPQIVRPDVSGRGDCSYCPAHAMDCAKAN